METKEIVVLMEKWLEQIKQITVNYTVAVSKLENAQLDYEKRTRKWYHTVLPYFLPLLTAILLLFAFVIAIKIIGCPNPIHLTFQDIELTQTCETSTVYSLK